MDDRVGMEYVLRPATIKKETPTQVFSCEFGEIFKSSFFPEHLRETVSATGLYLQKISTTTSFKSQT